MGRRRVPLPPERIKPFSGSIARERLSTARPRARRGGGARAVPLVDAGELSVVPARAATLDELEANALGGLRGDHRVALRRQLRERLLLAGCRVAQHDLGAEPRNSLELAVDHDIALEHHATQFGVLLSGLHLER